MKGMMYRTIALGLKWSTFRSAYECFFFFFSLYLYFSNLKSNIPVTSVCVDVDAQEESHCHLWAPLQRGRDGGKEGRASGQASGARWQKRAQPSRDEGHAGEGLLWNLVSVHVREFLSFLKISRHTCTVMNIQEYFSSCRTRPMHGWCSNINTYVTNL